MILRTGFKYGAIGFAIGFVGPMLLDPSSGNGPLLGIFITGPLGFITGLVRGAWLRGHPPAVNGRGHR
jgi:hypothetical protein